ncbi:MAG: alpha/beta hydrolase [Caulobacteraceae bacterium]
MPNKLPDAWVKAETVDLWPGRAPGFDEFKSKPLPDKSPAFFLRNTQTPHLHVFRPKTSNGRALLVIPGGAYEFVSISNEGVDVAERAGALGYTVFVLNYRLPAEGWRRGPDVPLQDAQRAVRVIKAAAGRFRVDPDRIAVIGFSAGGHLAASLATGFAEAVYDRVDVADQRDAGPAATALIYPVITMTTPFTHAGSRQNLLGSAPSDALVAARSPERHVGPATAPIFLAHAIDDTAVPVENSLMMLGAARAAKRPVEAHLFEEGGHAFGVGISGTPTSEWIPLLHLWLQRTFAAG